MQLWNQIKRYRPRAVAGQGPAVRPTDRDEKNIRNKKRTLSLKSITTLKENQLDTSFISLALTEGNVLFSKSNTSLDSCKIYQIELSSAIESKTKMVHLTIENWNKIAIVQEIEI